MATPNTPSSSPRVHIFEIDLIRAITVFSVVSIHALSATAFLIKGPTSSLQLLNLVIHLLHYNREMFMFVTGLVLTYAYFNRPFSAKKFWLKRALLVLFPYILWSLIYTKINNTSLPLAAFFHASVNNVLTGNASYQLYYILLAVQFYAVFPLFLLLLKKIAAHPWISLSISFFVQIVAIYLDFRFWQAGKTHPYFISHVILPFQDRTFLTYQFFFLFGAFSAIYMNQAYAFLKKYGRFLPIALGVTLIAFSLFFYGQLYVLKDSLGHATSVLQPSVVLYSIVVIIFFSWIATLWVKNRHWFGLIKVISDTSFGIYFVHVLFLTLSVTYLLPLLPSSVPVVLKMIFVVLCTFSASTLFCYMLLTLPLLGWTIGRGKK